MLSDADDSAGDSSSSYEAAVLKIVEEALGGESPQGRRRSPSTRASMRRQASPFLSDVRRRLRAEREALSVLLRQRTSPVRGRARAAANVAKKGVDQAKRRVGQVARRVRKQITGAEDRRLRDMLRQRLDEPPVIRLRDKFSFFLGVVGCALIEATLLLYPRAFPYCYAVCIVPLLVLRAYIYSSLGWQYFLIDFCYWSNAACLAQLFLFPASERLFLVNFLHTTGPLAMAIPTWRNSLVFHSLDKVTSVFIHMLPPLLAFSMRWYPPPHLELGETLHYGSALLVALGGYAAWQAFYLLCTEWLFRPNPSRMTSIRMLTLPAKDKAPPQCYSGITAGTWRVACTLGLMGSDEFFDSESVKTKLIFVSVQLLYTAATLVPACLLWNSMRAHAVYLISISALCVWNGGSYYIEVFSKAYRKQFEGNQAERREYQIQLLSGLTSDVPDGPPAHGEAASPTMAGAREKAD